MTQKEIIAGCKANDRRAQKTLVETYSSYLMGVCVRYTGDRYLAKDCLQESLVRILQKINTYSEKGKLKQWMAQVTAMKCLEIMRREKRYRSDEITDYEQSFSNPDNVITQISQKEVLQFISGLPDKYRIALNMFLVEGYSHKEIADILSVSEGTSRSLVSRGRSLIQKAFKDDAVLHSMQAPLRKVK